MFTFWPIRKLYNHLAAGRPVPEKCPQKVKAGLTCGAAIAMGIIEVGESGVGSGRSDPSEAEVARLLVSKSRKKVNVSLVRSTLRLARLLSTWTKSSDRAVNGGDGGSEVTGATGVG